jgi:hypothetical protein
MADCINCYKPMTHCNCGPPTTWDKLPSGQQIISNTFNYPNDVIKLENEIAELQSSNQAQQEQNKAIYTSLVAANRINKELQSSNTKLREALKLIIRDGETNHDFYAEHFVEIAKSALEGNKDD